MILFERLREPAKELEPVPVPKKRAEVVTLSVAWTPLVTFNDPAKLDDPVPSESKSWETETSPEKVKLLLLNLRAMSVPERLKSH